MVPKASCPVAVFLYVPSRPNMAFSQASGGMSLLCFTSGYSTRMIASL